MNAATPTTRGVSHLGECLGFCLWALVGFMATLGFISGGWFGFAPTSSAGGGWFLLVPAALIGYRISRRPGWMTGAALLGLVAGIGLCCLLVAAIGWSASHHLFPGDPYPDPAHWGGVGLSLIAAAVVGSAARQLFRS